MKVYYDKDANLDIVQGKKIAVIGSGPAGLTVAYYLRLKGLGKLTLQYDFQYNQRFEYDVRVGADRDKPAIDLELTTHTLKTDFTWDASGDLEVTAGLLGRYQDNFADPERIRMETSALVSKLHQRFIDEFNLPEYDAVILTESKELADYFEAAVEVCPQPKKVSNWMMTELLRELKGAEIDQCQVMPAQLGSLLNMVEEGTISGKIAKTVFEEMASTGKPPAEIVEAKGLVQVSDAGELESVVARVLAAAPDEVTAYRQGKTKLMGFFVGQVMRETRGQANPKLVNEILQRMLAA